VTGSYLLVSTYGGSGKPPSPHVIQKDQTDDDSSSKEKENISENQVSDTPDKPTTTSDYDEGVDQKGSIIATIPEKEEAVEHYSSLSGWVGDESGNAIHDAEIFAIFYKEDLPASFLDFKRELLAQTDKEGRYRIEHVCTGTLFLAAYKKGVYPMAWAL